MTRADTLIPSNNEVTLGTSSPCEVLEATESFIRVKLTSSPPGEHHIRVRVIGKGEARYIPQRYSFNMRAEIIEFYPTTAAMGGKFYFS